MILRPATADDVEALFDIRCSVVENYQSREELAEIGVTPEVIGAMIEGGDYVTTLAEIDGQAIAFSMAQLSEAYVFAVFVRLSHEGRGAGRAVLEAAETALRDHGVETAWLSTGGDQALRAVGFYRHLGWRFTGTLENGEVRFEKHLG
ncbi:MAG: GNAT family N-acetyltransferase [Verrucomicrobiota bacterium]